MYLSKTRRNFIPENKEQKATPITAETKKSTEPTKAEESKSPTGQKAKTTQEVTKPTGEAKPAPATEAKKPLEAPKPAPSTQAPTPPVDQKKVTKAPKSPGDAKAPAAAEANQVLAEALEHASPVPIHYEPPANPNAKGCYSHLERRVYVRPGMSEAQTFKTMLHEVSHAKLHALPVENGVVTGLPEQDRRTREIEAESVAYAGTAGGLDQIWGRR